MNGTVTIGVQVIQCHANEKFESGMHSLDILTLEYYGFFGKWFWCYYGIVSVWHDFTAGFLHLLLSMSFLAALYLPYFGQNIDMPCHFYLQGILVFASVMATLGLQILLESGRQITYGVQCLSLPDFLMCITLVISYCKS